MSCDLARDGPKPTGLKAQLLPQDPAKISGLRANAEGMYNHFTSATMGYDADYIRLN